MNRRTCIKITVDCLMTLTLLFLMAYSLAGEAAHEWAGSGMFILFIVHNLLNAHWSKNILKGTYTLLRVFRTLLIALIVLCMCSLMFSGIVLSKHIFTFLQIPGLTAVSRTLHMLASYWGFTLMSLHLGLHSSTVAAMLCRQRQKQSLPGSVIILSRILAFLCAAYGCSAFFKRGIASYMLYRTQFVFFDFAEPILFFFCDYAAVMWFFVLTAHYMAKKLKKPATVKQKMPA